jgi:hypothetical protein
MEQNPCVTPNHNATARKGSAWKRLLWLFGNPTLALLAILLLVRWLNPLDVFTAGGEPSLARMWMARAVLGIYIGLGVCGAVCLVALIGWRLTDYAD